MRSALLLIVALVIGYSLPAQTHKVGGIGIMEVGAPRRAADPEGFTFKLLLDNNKAEYAVSFEVTEGMTPSEKAEAIKDAIEADENLDDKVTVGRAGHVLTIEAKEPFDGVADIGYWNKSRQKGNKNRVSYPTPTVATRAATSSTIARVIMIGMVPDSAGDEVQVGTDRWAGSWDPSGFVSVAEMMEQIRSDLVSHGIDAVLENPWSIKINIDDELDGSLHFGNDCLTIDQWTYFETN